ncbi:hypothetical protein PVAG01_00138 [Phlyctema vagabunda]|uniref:Uncharacterized protein n=1 Tax=Phlyctema vagabunda TaxID=108571 RepID=A0ABR4PTD3_9HELO
MKQNNAAQRKPKRFSPKSYSNEDDNNNNNNVQKASRIPRMREPGGFGWAFLLFPASPPLSSSLMEDSSGPSLHSPSSVSSLLHREIFFFSSPPLC